MASTRRFNTGSVGTTVNRAWSIQSRINTTSFMVHSLRPIQLNFVFVLFSFVFTARKRSLGQGNIFSSVCQEFCTWGGLSQCMLGYHIPPGADLLPPEQTPPGTSPPGSRHPPCAVHAGRYGQQAGGMHPTGMQSCLF